MALIIGFIPLLVKEFMSIDKLLNPWPVVKNDIKKSSIDNVNAMSPLLPHFQLFLDILCF